MTIKIITLTLGPVHTNCYVLGDTETGDAIVIDPSDRARAILNHVQDEGWTVRQILATHGHFDHVMASADLKAATGAPFRLHELDLPLLHNIERDARLWLGLEVPPAAEPDGFVQPGETITAGAIALDVLFTPGHTPGHVSYVLRSKQAVFSGDVLFPNSVGRTDLPNASHATLMQSIVSQLLPLGDAFTVWPGHMHPTTIGDERRHNQFVIDYLRSHPDGA